VLRRYWVAPACCVLGLEKLPTLVVSDRPIADDLKQQPTDRPNPWNPLNWGDLWKLRKQGVLLPRADRLLLESVKVKCETVRSFVQDLHFVRNNSGLEGVWNRIQTERVKHGLKKLAGLKEVFFP